MKIARVVSQEFGEEPVYVVVEGDQIRLLDVSPVGEEMQTSSGPVPFNSIEEFLPPLDPPNIIAIGLNYRAHAQEGNSPIPERPVIFLKATSALNSHKKPIMLPEIAPDEVDYEAELGVIIGKEANKVSEDEALDYVLGYTCANDVSARDCQQRLDRQWARAKSFDTFAPVGPWVETELDPNNLQIRSILNGNVMQDSNTSDMIFSVEQLISYISHSLTLLPGTIIFTGTPSGVGTANDPPTFMSSGDTIEIEIEGIGTLKNPVVG